ncbi:MAG TPA: pyridoxal phosphate-dependent aminotransferase [Urbifossiella sp.]
MARPFWFTKFLVQSGIARFLPAARRLTDDGAACLRYYSDQVLAAPVEEFLDAAYFPTAGPDVIDLNLPAPRFESSVSLGRVIADRHGNPPPRGLPELRTAIADFYRRRDGRAIDSECEVFVTHGATGAFAAVLDAFVNPGDGVVLFDPSSPLFSLGARSRRADIRWVPTQNVDGRCHHAKNDLDRALRRAKLLVIANPANPTGARFEAEDLEEIMQSAAKRGVLVYLDESFGLKSRASGAISEGRVLRAGSISQEWGLGSVRVGWIAGLRHLVQACGLTANLHAPFVSTLCQQIAARAIEGADLSACEADPFASRRQYVVDRLRTLGLAPEPTTSGYFAWVSVASLGMDGRTFSERLLKEQRVLVRPGCVFGPSGANHIRISLAADDGRLREGLGRIVAFAGGSREAACELSAPIPSVPEVASPIAPAFSRA